MHGRDADHAWVFGELALQNYLADAVLNHGVPPFAIASVDGDAATNWHPRASGDEPQVMVVHELVPMLHERDLQTRRLGLWGWSLGGYRALAARHRPRAEPGGRGRREQPGTVAQRGADRARRVRRLGRLRPQQRVHAPGAAARDPAADRVGENDSFQANIERFRADLTQTPEGGVTPCFHDAAYWMRVAPAEIALLGTHLA